MAAVKTPCPVSREQFNDAARPSLPVTIDGKHRDVPVKVFSTGSLGWYDTYKVDIVVDGVRVPCQVQVSIIAANSKELPR